MEKGRQLPDWFLAEPPLMPGDDFYLTAFWDLSTCRQVGMSQGPIPWDKAVEYGERAGLDGDMVLSFVRIMRAMDKAYLDWQEEEAEKKRAQGQKSGGKTDGRKTAGRGTRTRR